MNRLKSRIPDDFFKGIIILKNKIATDSYHLKIQSRDFSKLPYATGQTVEFILNNPYSDVQKEVR
ncbi:hypothetical protein ABXT08_11035 [Chryseobacterium sp. NRRL B-14859]|uniref:hypothetical protein n=1 Tax=Chryseobacterium sp. NRRL B-14859 TaxID=1562763 RepID=UPI00339B2E9D